MDISDDYRSRVSINFLLKYCLNHANQEVDPSLILILVEDLIEREKSYSLDHNTFINNTIDNVETNLYYKKYYGNDKDRFNKYKNNFFSTFASSLINQKDSQYDEYEFNNIDDLFSNFCYDNSINRNKFKSIIFCLAILIEHKLQNYPIKPNEFPRFISTENQDDEELMTKLLDKTDESAIFTFKELFQFNEILSKYTKSFSLSPKLINLALQKFDNFLNTLHQKASNNDQFLFNYFITLDSESDEFRCFKLILIIKLRFYLINRQIYEFLTVLLQLLIIADRKKQDDNFFSKNFIDDILPNCNTRRTTLIRNISNEQIIDFSFSNDGQNDYILTKDGVFQIPKSSNLQVDFDLLKMKQIEFNTEEENHKIQQLLKQSNNDNAKIYFSNGILYLFIAEDKSIHRVVVSEDEELSRKKQEKQNKINKAKEYSEKNQPKNDAKSKINEKKEKRKKRKMERFEDEDDEREKNIESIEIDIPQYPVLSFGVFNNYTRIVQRKSCDDKKLTLVFTNVDLSPNSRYNYDIEEAFNDAKIDDKFTQTQIEIEIEEKIKIKDVLLSENSMYIVLNNSSFQKWTIFDNGELKLEKNIGSPFIFNSDSIIKMDNKKFLYFLDTIKNDEDLGVSITQMYLPETSHFLREENSLFLKYPFLQKVSNIIDNCSQIIINNDDCARITMKEFCDYLKEDKYDTKKSLFLSVNPDEMRFSVQPIQIIVPQLENIKILIKNLQNEDLKQFFISLFIKLTGINFLYETNKKTFDKTNEKETIDNLKAFKSFIIDLYSLASSSSSNSIDYNIIIKESMIFTLSIGGKFLFFSDSSYDELHNLMNQLLGNDETSKIMLKSLSSFIFSSISSLYIIDQEIYDKLIEMNQEIDLYHLFKKNILLILIEYKYSLKLHDDEFILSISPYIKVLFQYFRSVISVNDVHLSKT